LSFVRLRRLRLISEDEEAGSAFSTTVLLRLDDDEARASRGVTVRHGRWD